jgi:hypothetical protein
VTLPKIIDNEPVEPLDDIKDISGDFKNPLIVVGCRNLKAKLALIDEFELFTMI